jgi:hypothetical protein
MEIETMRKPNRTVRAEIDRNGVVIYRLMQGVKKPKMVRAYGYGTKHKVWMQVHMTRSWTSMSAAPAAMVKEQIALWTK